jgi:hypothetical protein
MKKLFTLFLLINCFFTLSLASESDINKILTEAHMKSKNLKAPAVASLWGGQRRFKIFHNNNGEILSLKSSLLKSGNLNIYISKKPSNKLIIFFPGIFGSIQKGITPHMIGQLEKTPTNLLVLSNFLSTEHISAHPLYGDDPFKTETLILEQALDFSLLQLNNKKLEIHVIAESLGSIVASAWVSEDQKKNKRIKSLTLLWPPFELKHAMKNFDKIVNEHRKANHNCHIINKAWLLTKEMLLKDFPDSLSKSDEICLGSIVLIDGFMGSMKKSWEAHSQTSGNKTSTPESFEDFFKSYRKELWHLLVQNHESIKLTTWLSKIKSDANFPIFLFTSKNDFLNNGKDLEEFKKSALLSDNEILVFPWGGHSGPVGMTEFTQILMKFSPAYSTTRN